jgi:hypothetical protein
MNVFGPKAQPELPLTHRCFVMPKSTWSHSVYLYPGSHNKPALELEQVCLFCFFVCLFVCLFLVWYLTFCAKQGPAATISIKFHTGLMMTDTYVSPSQKWSLEKPNPVESQSRLNPLFLHQRS